MGYQENTGLILRRRDLFEDDQEISLLTSSGCLSVRAPHARRSQKTFCGRLEPPNEVTVRLYRSKKQSQWLVSSIEINEVFAELLRVDSVRDRLWPLLALFRDLFPEGEAPGKCLPHLKKGMKYLKQGFEPVLLLTNRILATAADHSGIALEVDTCARCGRNFEDVADTTRLNVSPEHGPYCPDCGGQEENTAVSWTLSGSSLKLYERLADATWEEVCARPVRDSDLDELEELLYRLFHYHFEISLETLKVRKAL